MGILDRVTGALALSASLPPIGEADYLGEPEAASPWADNSHLVRVTAEELWGVEASRVGRSAAMSVPAIAKARHVVCSKLASVPLHLLGADDRPLVAPLLTDPDPDRTTAWAQRLWTVDDLLFYGRAYWLITGRYVTGTPSRAQRVHPTQVDYDPKTATYVIGGQEYGPRDVIRFDGPHEGLLNIGGGVPIAAIADVERAYRKAAKNPTPVTRLHYPGPGTLDKTEREELRSEWVKARKDPDGGVAVTSGPIEVHEHGSIQEHLLTDGRNAAAVDAARLVGVPASAVDAAPESGSSLNYTTVPARARELITFGLGAYADAVEAALTAVHPRGQRVAHDFDAITRDDFETRMRGYQAAIDAGVYTADECRAMERGEGKVTE